MPGPTSTDRAASDSATYLSLRHIIKRFDRFTALDDVSLEVPRGSLVTFLGPSGCGKTTLLRIIAGLETQDQGTITQDGRDVSRLPAIKRDYGIVFQSYALFPNLSVAENVEYGLVNRKVAREARAGRVKELLALVGMPDAGAKYPSQLSGGQQQRVAIARALATSPGLLLLDEPLSALDAHTRTEVRSELHELLRELGLPTVLVTHDFEDAAALADRIGVIVDGQVVQEGSAGELVGRPRNAFVASLTGASLLRGIARAGRDGLTEIVLDTGASAWSTDEAEGRVGVAVHAWEVSIAREAPDDSALNHLRGAIASVTPLGNRARIRVGELVAEVSAASVERLQLREGEVVVASFKATAARLVPLA
jgi:iron(III) transport system ATP-binding protein